MIKIEVELSQLGPPNGVVDTSVTVTKALQQAFPDAVIHRVQIEEADA